MCLKLTFFANILMIKLTINETALKRFEFNQNQFVKKNRYFKIEFRWKLKCTNI